MMLQAVERQQNAESLRSYHRSFDRLILLASDDPADLREWALLVQSDELVTTIKRAEVRIEVRNAALEELVEREDQALVPVVISRLGKEYLADPLRHALLRATPRIQVTDESWRRALAANLWDMADKLQQPRNNEEEGLLWTAIRRYATLRPEANIGKLVEFLGEPDEPLPRRHVVLLAIQNAFYGWAPTDEESAKLESLRKRVSELARRYLDAKWLETPHGRAVVQNSYCAAAALGCADLLELTSANRALKQSWLTEFTLEKLSQTLGRWRTAKEGLGSAAIAELVEQSITLLNQPMP